MEGRVVTHNRRSPLTLPQGSLRTLHRFTVTGLGVDKITEAATLHPFLFVRKKHTTLQTQGKIAETAIPQTCWVRWIPGNFTNMAPPFCP
ncbi:Atrial natriuretic peptide clearance receptor [Echinococcus multilocularis]|uniref:Atrial natriuretic peptide clearance receptor n=1 Tax=Echinococcus multilocularis TaxID=6211 RepID=A0A0S4MJ84_ECHMU|nr:Atrial natriuretic peptide clearance receptor [Echinococcus multilocularis]